MNSKYILAAIGVIVLASAAGFFLFVKTQTTIIVPGKTVPTLLPAPTPTPAAEKSGIKGIAMLGPMCPVERIPPDPQCADRPYKTVLLAEAADATQIQKQVEQFDSDANGNFSVDLSPGEYVISSANTASMFSHCLSNGTIKVNPGEYTTITLHCDTGIR